MFLPAGQGREQRPFNTAVEVLAGAFCLGDRSQRSGLTRKSGTELVPKGQEPSPCLGYWKKHNLVSAYIRV
jgi:hypothetical protein